MLRRLLLPSMHVLCSNVCCVLNEEEGFQLSLFALLS